jgi:hypothetical protein
MKKPFLLKGVIVVSVPSGCCSDPHNRPYIDKALKAATGKRRPYYRWKVLDTTHNGRGWEILVEFTMQTKQGLDIGYGNAYVPHLAEMAPLPTPSRQRLEYLIIDLSHTPGDDEAVLDKAGLEGWELVAASNGRVFFKRPV